MIETDEILLFLSGPIGMLDIITIRTSFESVMKEISKSLKIKFDGIERISDKEGVAKAKFGDMEENLPVFLTRKGNILGLLKYIKRRNLESDVIIISPVACLKSDESEESEESRREVRYLAVFIPSRKIKNMSEKEIFEEIKRKMHNLKFCEQAELINIMDYRINELAYEYVLIAETVKNLSEMINDLAEMLNIISDRISIIEGLIFGHKPKKEDKKNENKLLFT